MSFVLEEHRNYLDDPVRLAAFTAALRQAVRPGDVVLDLGCGTGILGLLACQAGASRVYAVEATGIIDLARAIAAANGVADRVTFIQGHSSDITLPEPVDVIVSDQIGFFGFEAGLIEHASDARDRFLRPGGRVVPRSVQLIVAPIDDAAAWAPIAFWQARPAGFDFDVVAGRAVNDRWVTTTSGAALLGAGAVWATVDLGTAGPDPLAGRVGLVVERPGTLHGLAGFFTADLAPDAAPDVRLTNAPGAGARVRRSNVFLPLEAPVPVEAGDRVHAALHALPREHVLTWVVEVVRDGALVARSRHSTWAAALLSRADLRRTDPRAVPVLTDRGRARRTVLALCDGRRALAEVEREVAGRHPDLFRSPAEAAAFVSDVVAGLLE